MTLAELKAETFRRLEESATSPVFWTVADVVAALNAGYRELSDASEWYERWLTVGLLPARPYYDLRTVLPSTIPLLSIGLAYNDQTSRWLIPTTVRELDGGDLRWEQRVAEPERVGIRGLWWLWYWPRTSASTGTIKQYYTALPPALVNDTDEPGFPATLHLGLVEYALADLAAQDAEVTQTTAAWTRYLEYERVLSEWVAGRISTPLVQAHGAITR